MDNAFILPWQQDIWQSISRQREQARMPHALLFSGNEGVGKMRFAGALAASMLCSAVDANGRSCGRCKSCHLIAAGSHPDFLKVMPDEKSQVIKIDQVRDIVDFVNGTALLGGYRVIIINPAAAMNIYAANALLKTLEEPTPQTLLILVNHPGRRLPATIISRCQRIDFHKPDADKALAWLKNCHMDAADKPQDDSGVRHGDGVKRDDLELILNLANGAPLKAQEYLENDIVAVRNQLFHGLIELSQRRQDPLQLAAAWQEQDKMVLIDWLLLWLNDLLRCKLTDSIAPIVNKDRMNELKQLAERISLLKLLDYIERAQQTQARLMSAANLNQQLMLEEILIEWTLCF